MIEVNIQRDWGHVAGLIIGTYAIVQGAAVREWNVWPRRSSTEPFKFTPRWYQRLSLVLMGAMVAALSLWSLLK